jgi:hypothetical protein
VPHENLFVARWYCAPRLKGADREHVPEPAQEQEVYDKAFGVYWVQFRLNDAGDGIDIVQPPAMMRQVGYEDGPQYCELEPTQRKNTWYVPPAPYNEEMSQWVCVPHFTRGIAAVLYSYNAGAGRYEWVRTGPLLATAPQCCFVGGPGRLFTETSTLRHRDSWIVLARTGEAASPNAPGVAWFRTDDLFAPLPEPVYPGAPASKSPGAAIRCPDGVIRLFTNDPTASPYGNDRDPLYCWDIDPDGGFRPSHCRVVFDATAAGLPVRDLSRTRVDMPNLWPHAGGREQLLVCRARLRCRKYPFTRITDEEKARSGVYGVRIAYDQEYPCAWQFE